MLIGLTVYGYSIDSSIRVKFEGKRWDIPAQAYARPLELYSGKNLTIDDFVFELDLLGYRKIKQVGRSGTYWRQKNQVQLFTREFTFWDDTEASKNIIVTFNKKTINKVRTQTGEEEFLVRLDPLSLGSFYAGKGEDRSLIKLAEIPDIIQQTLIAVEDKEFYSHFGISPVGIARAMITNFKSGTMKQGGSTITQQLAKNFYYSKQRTLTRKLKEAVTAIILEIHYSKAEILEVYLNEVFFAQNGQRRIHGIGMAGKFFYGRPPEELTIAQVASLIGILKATTSYNPRRNPNRAKIRRDLIIDILVKDEIISNDVAILEKSRPVITAKKSSFGRTNTKYPGFMDMVKQQLLTDYNKQELLNDGIKVFTTFNPITQRKANLAVQNTMPKLDKLAKLEPQTLQTAMVITKTKTGEVEAVIGGRDFSLAGFNRAINTKRHIGSLIKPIIYLSALEYYQYFTLATLLNDTSFELEYNGKDWQPRDLTKEHARLLNAKTVADIEALYDDSFMDRLWQPKNYNKKEHDNVILIDSLAKSYNLATARLGIDIGIANVIKKLRVFGYDGKINHYPSILLGAVNMSPMQVAQYYLSLANKGFYIKLRAIKSVINQNGEPLKNYNIILNKVADESVAYLTYTAMRRAVTHGTAKKINYNFPKRLNIAGKTGTTNEYRDSWFAGFSGNYLTVTWVGQDNNQSTNLSGSAGALTLWIDMMKKLNLTAYNFPTPKNIEHTNVHRETGNLVENNCSFALNLPFIKGSIPRDYSECLPMSEMYSDIPILSNDENLEANILAE